MGFSITAIRSVRKKEERRHYLYRLPMPTCNMKVRPLKHGKVVYIVKKGKKISKNKVKI